MPQMTNEILSIAWDTDCNVFIESGTFYGTTYRQALDTGIFQQVYSVEIQDGLYNELIQKFKQTDRQRIFHGDSRQVIGEKILPLCGADDRIFFWLDGHFSGGPTGGGDTECPLLGELEAIQKAAPSASLVIAIDDTDDFGRRDEAVQGLNWPTREQIEALLYQINPDFHCLDFTGQGQYERQARGVLVYSYRPLSLVYPQKIKTLEQRISRIQQIRYYRTRIVAKIRKWLKIVT